MPINSTHAQYDRMLPRWERMRDVCEGEDAIKDAGDKYLPRPNSDIKTPEANQRYEGLLKRAVFIEVTKDTLDKYTGQAFKDDPVVTVDPLLDYLKRDANGSGVSIYQLAQKAFDSQLSHGSGYLYVDYPVTDGEASIADVERKKLRPTISFYAPESVINWRTTTQGGQTKTSMVVLSEQVEQIDADDPFVCETVQHWRYLGLDDTGQYFVEVWQKVADSDTEFTQIGETIYPKKAGNEGFTEIPFIPCNADTNDWSEQNIPLESLAKVNLHHYLNSAAYEDSVFYCGQVQPWMSGVSEQRMEAINKMVKDKGFRVGSGQMLMLEANGNFGYAQATPNILAGEAMDKKYAVMMQLGAKLAESDGVTNKTATQSDHENDIQNSTASMCIANLNESFYDAIVFCYQFLGIEPNDDTVFKAKQDFVAPKADNNTMTVIGNWVMSGLAPKSMAFDYAKKYNLLDAEMNNETVQELIDADDMGIDLGE